MALFSCLRVESVRASERGSRCARCRRKTWKVSGTEGAAAPSWHGALESVSAKCNEEPFLYTTVNCNAVGKASFSAGVLVPKEDPSGRFIEETDGQCVQ